MPDVASPMTLARLVPLVVLAAACAGRQTPPTTPQVRELEAMRITAERNEDGDLEMAAYDAEMLFREGNRRLDTGRCDEAVPLYDKVADEFPSSRFVSPALYNAGLCLMEGDDLPGASARFERLLREVPGSGDTQHTRFQLAAVYLGLERWDDALEQATILLDEDDLSPDERVEAIARAAQAHLGAGRRDEAAERARTALAYARTRPDDDRVQQVYMLAAANYVYAETLRLRAEEIALPEGGVAVQRPALEPLVARHAVHVDDRVVGAVLHQVRRQLVEVVAVRVVQRRLPLEVLEAQAERVLARPAIVGHELV